MECVTTDEQQWQLLRLILAFAQALARAVRAATFPAGRVPSFQLQKPRTMSVANKHDCAMIHACFSSAAGVEPHSVTPGMHIRGADGIDVHHHIQKARASFVQASDGMVDDRLAGALLSISHNESRAAPGLASAASSKTAHAHDMAAAGPHVPIPTRCSHVSGLAEDHTQPQLMELGQKHRPWRPWETVESNVARDVVMRHSPEADAHKADQCTVPARSSRTPRIGCGTTYLEHYLEAHLQSSPCRTRYQSLIENIEERTFSRSPTNFTTSACSSPWSLYSVEWDEPWPSFDRPEFSDVETSKYELPTSCNSFQDSAEGSLSTAQGRNASTSQEGSQGLTADPSGGKRQRGDTESPNGLREPAAKRTRHGAKGSRKQPEIECIWYVVNGRSDPNDAKRWPTLYDMQ